MSVLNFFAVLLLMYSCNVPSMKTITKNDMSISWKVHNDSLWVEAYAPAYGWVAVGFNTTDQLKGTNLIMGNVIKSKITIEDHYIRRPGDHIPVLALAGIDALQDRNGHENGLGTTISFRLPLAAVDQYHIDLQEGKSYYLLMAYSQKDDFYHHSMMRTFIKIIL